MNGTLGFDMVGKRFGTWTVIRRGKKRKGVTLWECRCDCGTVRQICGWTLRNGKASAKCSDCHRKYFVITDTFVLSNLGKLSDPELAERSGIGEQHIRNERQRRGIEPKPRWNDLTGNRYGKWTVLGRCEPVPGKRNSRSRCRCDCGNERCVLNLTLVAGQSTNCGCVPTAFTSKQDRFTPEILERMKTERIQDIAAEIGLSLNTVRKKAKSIGINRKRGRPRKQPAIFLNDQPEPKEKT